MITITESAIKEINRVRTRTIRESPDEKTQDVALRLSANLADRNGMPITMSLDYTNEKDNIMLYHGVTVIIDPESFKLIQNITVDFVDNKRQQEFKFFNSDTKVNGGAGGESDWENEGGCIHSG